MPIPPSTPPFLYVPQSHLTYIKRYKIGDTFINLPLSEAQSLLSTSTEEIEAEVSKLEDSMGDLKEELQKLKAALYARFGRSINLEA